MEKEKSHSFSLKTAQRQAFLEIFNLHAKDGRITKKDLDQIFERINYSISERHFNQICQRAFSGGREQITFQEFMQTFNVKESAFDMVDVRNAFRLIAGDQDRYIPAEKLIQVFRKQEVQQERIDDLLTILSTYIDEEKRFDYRLFLSHLT